MSLAAPLAILAIGLAGCGRLAFDDEVRPDATTDATTDAATVDSPSGARCSWSAGPPFTQGAVLRPDLSMPDTEYDPFLVPGDPLTINYVARIGSSGELFEAHRVSTSMPFDAPVMRTDLGSPTTEESALALEAGGLHGYFNSNQNGANEIYEVARATTADPFQIVRRLDELVTTGQRYDPFPFAGGLGLAYTEAPVGQPGRTWFASRATTADRWGNLVESPFSAQFDAFSGATLTSDGLVIVFSATGAGGQNNIWYSTRSSLMAAFGPAQLVVLASSPVGDHEPSLRDDGCELFFARDTGIGTKWDIYSLPAVAP